MGRSVFLCPTSHSHYSCLLERGLGNNTRGPGTITQQLGCGVYIDIVEAERVEIWKLSKTHHADTDTHPLRITVL